MQYASTTSGDRIVATKDKEGFCPGCSSKLQPKALISKHVVPHWAHKAGDCDPWYEPESEWHRTWKERWPVECREVVMGPHRADVRMRDGTVLELQKSPISSEEIAEREQFYGNMLWLLDARAWDIGRRDVSYAGSDSYGDESYDRWNISMYPLRRMALENEQRVTATWRRPKRTWSISTKPLLLDVAPGCVVRVDHIDWAARVGAFIKGRVFILDECAYNAHIVALAEALERAEKAERQANEKFNAEVLQGSRPAPWSPPGPTGPWSPPVSTD